MFSFHSIRWLKIYNLGQEVTNSCSQPFYGLIDNAMVLNTFYPVCILQVLGVIYNALESFLSLPASKLWELNKSFLLFDAS